MVSGVSDRRENDHSNGGRLPVSFKNRPGEEIVRVFIRARACPGISLGFGLVGQSPTLGAHCPPQRLLGLTGHYYWSLFCAIETKCLAVSRFQIET